jgi:hypothetical protein
MNQLTRWDPFREFTTLQDRMTRLFRDALLEEFVGQRVDGAQRCRCDGNIGCMS